MMKSNIIRENINIDAKGEIFGRLATKVANILRGKNKTSFVYNQDIGDTVIIKNIGKLKFTGNKLTQKKYYRHTGYIGNLKTQTLQEKYQQNPQKTFSDAVKGMLPSNRLRNNWLKRIKYIEDANE